MPACFGRYLLAKQGENYNYPDNARPVNIEPLQGYSDVTGHEQAVAIKSTSHVKKHQQRGDDDKLIYRLAHQMCIVHLLGRKMNCRRAWLAFARLADGLWLFL
jgi:hypothetical protein